VDAELTLELFRHALVLTLLLALPPLLAIWLLAWLVGALQAVLGIPDASLGMVPRFVLALLAWAASLPWIMAELSAFSLLLFDYAL
jgi:flagellar biosynthesis protein FliQ